LAEFDTPEWRAERNAKLAEWFLHNGDAIALFLDFCQLSEVWDDLIDKDKIPTDEEVSDTFNSMLIRLPTNPFYLRYQGWFTCLSILVVNAYHDANQFQLGDKRQRHIAYHLRKMIIEFACLIAFCAGGFPHMRKVSLEIREFFIRETYEDWELSDAQLH